MGPVTLRKTLFRSQPTDGELTDRAEKWQRSHLDLFVGRNGAKDDLREALRRKHPEADPSDHTAIFDEGKRLVLPVEKKKHR